MAASFGCTSTVFLFCSFMLLTTTSAATRGTEQGSPISDHPTRWAIKLPSGLSEEEARSKLSQIAAEHSCRVVGRVGNLKDYFVIEHDPASHPHKRSVADVEGSLGYHPDVEWAEFQHPRSHEKRLDVTDPLFRDQWHLQNTRGVDLNVMPAWDSGYSGRGVAISIVDDSLEWRHRDLGAQRYLSDASFDWNSQDGDPSPSRNDDTHGTSCGGLAFAGMNNGVCGVGIAYDAPFSAQRLISGPTTDETEASALSYKVQQNFIFSASWGPTDDGTRKEGPGRLLQEAMADSVINGRNGKGSIYVWAGGNGGSRDNVNYDGYANSIYSIAIASLDGNGRHPSYSEEGACLIASSPSSPPGIATIAVHDRCTTNFGGTSAAAPMVAGVVALMLEANPDLTWRDVQNILIKTATKNDPNDQDWTENGAKLHVNHKYGFGLVNTKAAVDAAVNRSVLLPPTVEPAVITVEDLPATDIPDNNPIGVVVTFQVAPAFTVEHVELNLRAVHTRRGDLRVVLISPAGTRSVLAVPHGDHNANYVGWTFTSVRHWDENSAGKWRLLISDEFSGAVGQFNRATLTVRGH